MRGTLRRTPERVELARELRAEGKLYREIGELLGVNYRTVQEWLTDPDRTQRDRRKASYRGTCIDCGAPTDGNDGPNAPASDRCDACFRAYQKTREYRETMSGNGTKQYTDQELLDHLRALAGDDGRLLCETVKAANGPTVPVFVTRFGTWRNALLLAGLRVPSGKVRGTKRIDQSVMLDAIRACAADIGREPTARDYDTWARGRDAPCHVTIRNRLDGWMAATEAAIPRVSQDDLVAEGIG